MTLIKPERFVEDKEQVKIPRTKQEIEEYLKVLPNPVGYRLLIKPYAGKNKTKGGIYLSEKKIFKSQTKKSRVKTNQGIR